MDKILIASELVKIAKQLVSFEPRNRTDINKGKFFSADAVDDDLKTLEIYTTQEFDKKQAHTLNDAEDMIKDLTTIIQKAKKLK